MKDKEILEQLRAIKNRWWGSDGESMLKELIKALEANPPLAEVEGRLYRSGDGRFRLGFVFEGPDGWPNEQSVTAAIRKRDVQARR